MTFDRSVPRDYASLYKGLYFSIIAIFFFSFISKAGINIFTGIAYLATFFLLWRIGLDSLRAYPWWIFFVIPLCVGLCLASFTVAGGFEEMGHFLTRFKFFLLPLAIILVANNRKIFLNFFLAVLVSALLISAYGFSQSEQRVLGGFHGVHFILRNADMLVVVILTMLVFLMDKNFRAEYKKWLWFMWPTLVLFIFGLVMSASRGSWLGFMIGVLVLGIFFYRRILILVIPIILVVVMFSGDSKFASEAESIADLETNHSNSARLQLWQSGWDFSLNQFWLGAGHSQIEPLFLDYFYHQPKNYQQKYSLVTQYPWDFHNSYLQILVEWGAIHFFTFVVCGTILLFRLYRSLFSVLPENQCFVRAAIVVSTAYLPAQFFHNELYGYGTILYLLVLTSGLAAVNWQAERKEKLQRSALESKYGY